MSPRSVVQHGDLVFFPPCRRWPYASDDGLLDAGHLIVPRVSAGVTAHGWQPLRRLRRADAARRRRRLHRPAFFATAPMRAPSALTPMRPREQTTRRRGETRRL